MGKLPIILNQYANIVMSNKAKALQRYLKIDNRMALAKLPQVEKQHRLNWTQFKILAAILSEESKNSDKEQLSPRKWGKYRINIKDLVEMVGVSTSGSSVNYVAEILSAIVGKVLVIPKTYDQELGEDCFVVIPPFSQAEYDGVDKEVFFTLNPELVPYLQNVRKQFTLAPIKELISLPSIQSGRMLLLLHYCKGFNSAEKRTFVVKWLLEYFNVPSEQTWRNTWLQLRDLKEAIVKYTPWSFEFVFIKDPRDMRKVLAVRIDRIKYNGVSYQKTKLLKKLTDRPPRKKQPPPPFDPCEYLDGEETY